MVRTRRVRLYVWQCVLLALAPWATQAFGQGIEEVIVTGSYRTEQTIPGTFLKRRGDSLLLQATVANDSRDEDARQGEIYATLRNAVTAARQSGIELSVVDGQGNVIALDSNNYEIELEGSDVLTASIRLKKPIPAGAANPEQIVADLLKFVKRTAVVGRTTFEAEDAIEISIIDPQRYRAQIIRLFGQDAAQVRAALGPDYRLVVRNIDRPVEFARVGALDVALFIPYSYVVVPVSMSSYVMPEEE